MFKNFLVMLISGLMLGGLFNPALADSANQLGGKFGISGNIGYNLYAMDDIYGEMAGPGISLDVSSGLSFDGGVSYAITDELMIGLEAAMLQANHTYEWDAFYSYKNEYNLPALEAVVVAKYLIPCGDNILLSVGAAAGLLTMDGILKFGVDGYETLDTEISGSTIDIKLMAGSQIFLSPWLAWNVDLGYRMAKITEVTIDSTDSITDTEIESVDYTGLFAKTGISLYF